MSSTSTDQMPMLRVDDLHVTYHSAVRAVDGVSIELRRGEIVTVLGPNGAGKTTTLRAIGGFAAHEPARITRGTVRLGPDDITHLRPEERAQRGIGIVPEAAKIFDRLTVEEHIRAVVPRKEPGKRDQLLAMFPRLGERLGKLAGLLSGGERQMLAIGMTLVREPDALLIDELSLGLGPQVVDELLAKMVEIHQELGVGVLLVEQNVDKALAIAHRCYLLAGGRVVGHAPAAELRGRRSDIWDLLIGRDLAEAETDGRMRRLERDDVSWSEE